MSTETQETELTAAKVVLRKNGDLVQSIDGADVVVAHFYRTSGHLEFATKEASVKLYQQVIARLGTVNKGMDPSGVMVKSFGVKGDPVPDLAKLPKKPKMGPLGDCTPEVVEWYFEHNLPEAIIRYGVYTDAKGKPVRKNVRRTTVTIADRRNEDDDSIEWVKKGKTSERAPVREEGEYIEEKNAIIARRSTHMTFTPKEVVGGFELEDDDMTPVEGGDE